MELHQLLGMGDEALDGPLAKRGTATAARHAQARAEREPWRMTGWKPERPGYWSEDPLLSWRGACPHPNCGCEISYDPRNMTAERGCINIDCPWDELRANELKPKPTPDVVELHRRFSGLDID